MLWTPSPGPGRRRPTPHQIRRVGDKGGARPEQDVGLLVQAAAGLHILEATCYFSSPI
jgi:hypothetical protein